MTDLWPKKKKVLTRKERFRITEDVARKKDKEENVEKLVLQKQQQIERLEWEEKIEYEKADKEQVIRRWRLKPICERFRDRDETIAALRIRCRDEQTAANHPDVANALSRIVPWMNERLSRWSQTRDDESHLHGDIDDCFALLDTLTAYVDGSTSIERSTLWHDCRTDLRNELYRKFDRLTYGVLRNVEKNMSYSSADTLYHRTSTERCTHAVWTVADGAPSPTEPAAARAAPANAAAAATAAAATKDDKFPLLAHFEECGVTVSLPKTTFHRQTFAVRCLVVYDDYFSNDCRTYDQPPSPEGCNVDFDAYHRCVWQRREQRRRRLADDERDLRAEWRRRRSIVNKIKQLVPAPSAASSAVTANADVNAVSAAENAVDERPAADAHPKDVEYLQKVINLKRAHAQWAADEERAEIEGLRRQYAIELEQFECNMRRYYVVGGVYHVNAVKRPPQPRTLRDGAVLRMIVGADRLQMWPYRQTYEAAAVKAGPPKQSTDDDDDEAESTPEGNTLSKLVLVVIKLPDHVLWFDAPTPVRWDAERSYWSTEYVYDVKFNEEKQTISFRAGLMSSAFGLAVFRYNHFPYQSWELKADDANTCETRFSLTTSTLVLEFRLRANQVCLVALENANTSALQELVDVFYEPSVLARLLKRGGVNIFPGDDGCLYVDGAPVKHRVTEHHLYRCMASLCCRYRFASCRWNMMAGYKRFVLQASECGSEKGSQLAVVTDERAFVTDAADVTQALNECDSMERTFHPDLMSLAEDCGATGTKRILDAVDPILVETVHWWLAQVRVLSLS